MRKYCDIVERAAKSDRAKELIALISHRKQQIGPPEPSRYGRPGDLAIYGISPSEGDGEGASGLYLKSGCDLIDIGRRDN